MDILSQDVFCFCITIAGMAVIATVMLIIIANALNNISEASKEMKKQLKEIKLKIGIEEEKMPVFDPLKNYKYMTSCPNCNNIVYSNDKYCSKCGQKFPENRRAKYE